MPQRLASTPVGGVRLIAQVLPGTEAPAFPGQQQDPHLRVIAHQVQGCLNLAVHRRVEAVELFGAVEAEKGHALADGEQDGGEVHGRGALCWAIRRTPPTGVEARR